MSDVALGRGWLARQRSIGADGGWVTFALSNLVLLATAGLSGLWLWYRVWRVACDTPVERETAIGGWIVVLGSRLCHDQITPGYARRLQRAAALYAVNPQQRIVLVGGRTSGAVSEAERGRAYLLELSLSNAQLLVEDQSLNTLDNLRRARQLFPDLQQQPFVLITSRHHLARSRLLAHGLGLQPILCAAESRSLIRPVLLWRCGLEAYYLHWYMVGKRWSHWTGNARNLARIS